MKKKITYDMRIPKAHILCNTSVECRVAVEVQGGELRNMDNFLFGRWENYVSVSLLEPTMPITRGSSRWLHGTSSLLEVQFYLKQQLLAGKDVILKSSLS